MVQVADVQPAVCSLSVLQIAGVHSADCCLFIIQIAGVHPKMIHNKSDGTFDLKELEELLQHRQDPHQCYTRLICLENTHNYCGGKVLPFDFLKKVTIALCDLFLGSLLEGI